MDAYITACSLALAQGLGAAGGVGGDGGVGGGIGGDGGDGGDAGGCAPHAQAPMAEQRFVYSVYNPAHVV